MEDKYLLKSGMKTARMARLIAKAIDLLIVGFFGLIFYPWGILISLAYLSVADSLQNGQSVGKKIIGFAVISLEDGSPCSLKQSVIRNLPFLVPLAFAIVPIWGWVLSAFFGLSLVALELYLLFTLDSGNRLGDVMADTTVVSNIEMHADVRKISRSWFDRKPSTIS